MKQLFLFTLISFLGLHNLKAQKEFFVFLNSNPDKPEMDEKQVEKLMEGHLANINKLAEAGKLTAAGPFEGGGGIFVLVAKSREEAISYLAEDPGVQSNRWNMEYLPLKFINSGTCKTEKPYEMVTYQFVRILPKVKRKGDIRKALRQHKKFVKGISEKDLFVAAGEFQNPLGGFLILKVDSEEQVKQILEKDEALSGDRLSYTLKPLWIAKGTFCQ